MVELPSEETIKAKEASEHLHFAADHGGCTKQYHAGNGYSADNALKPPCEQQRQTVSYCVSNANFQNIIAERAIRDLSESKTIIRLHVTARLTTTVHLCLWPDALRTDAVSVLLDG